MTATSSHDSWKQAMIEAQKPFEPVRCAAVSDFIWGGKTDHQWGGASGTVTVAGIAGNVEPGGGPKMPGIFKPKEDC